MNGKTVVITGASRGLGAALARAFAAEGAHVAICARNDSEGLEGVAVDIEADGGSVTALGADARDEFDMERLMEFAVREGTGQIDLLVPCAGVYHGDPGHTPLTEESYTAFDDTLRTNGRGVFAAITEAVPHLADDARILVPSGNVAREAVAGYGAYAVSKAVAEAVVRGFAVELDQPVVTVAPGLLATELTGGKGRDPEEVVPFFAWAATEADLSEYDGGVLDLKAWKAATR